MTQPVTTRDSPNSAVETHDLIPLASPEAEGSGTGSVPTAPKFGTFLGVFTPSVLTILGLIMYLRFGWVVGNVGLGLTFVIVLMASSITTITALSASAVATNMRVGVGGEYFLISHSLGPELGGAIGIPLFLCRTLSITFYSFGLAESVASLWPATWTPLPPSGVQLIAAATIVVITAVSGRSAAAALKLQIPIMIAVALSMIALVAGVFSGPLHEPQWESTFRTAPQGFWYVFAVFFPAVTGFTAGIGMSGDLRDPRHSIPRGTLGAVATCTVIYLLIPVLLGITGRIDSEQLTAPGTVIWASIAVLGPWLVYPGVWGAILSSAFGSVLGGPRVLQALASDGLAPKFLAKLSRTGQPTVATWASGAIALAAVALGGLNTVAQFVTILFLTLYVTINLSAAIEQLVGDPHYRPTLRVPWPVALAGALGAIVMMFLINPWACAAAAFLELLLYLWLRRLQLKKGWGDVRAGLWVALARYALVRLRRHADDARNWRPHLLVFAGDTAKRRGLVRLAGWFNQNRGVVTVCRLVEGDLENDDIDIAAMTRRMDEDLASEDLVTFNEVNVVPRFEDGVVGVAQANGIAGLQSNTLMFGWSRKRHRLETALRLLRPTSRLGKSVIIARLIEPQTGGSPSPGRPRRIDLWWGGLEHNGDLMLLLAYLLRLNPQWRGARLVLRSIVNDETERAAITRSLAKLMPETRIQAESEIILRPPGQSVAEILHAHSHDADLVFLGLRDPGPGQESAYAERLIELAQGLPTTVFVRNASEFAGKLAH